MRQDSLRSNSIITISGRTKLHLLVLQHVSSEQGANTHIGIGICTGRQRWQFGEMKPRRLVFFNQGDFTLGVADTVVLNEMYDRVVQYGSVS